MRDRFRRFAVVAVAMLVLALFVAPVALRAAHSGHFCAHADCPVCTVIQSDLAILKTIATAAVAAFALITALLRAPAAVLCAARGYHALLPIQSKVRMNN